jgi:hypothetical protein
MLAGSIGWPTIEGLHGAIDYLEGQGFRVARVREMCGTGSNPRKLDANAAYLSAAVPRTVAPSQDDGAET